MKLFYSILFLSSTLFSQNVYVIANQKIATSKEEVKNFFSAKSDYLNGSKYKRISNKEALEALAEIAFSITKRKLSKKWIKQNFRKGTPFPVTLENDVKTIHWIKSHKKTIGFVIQKPKNIQIVYTFRK